MSVMGHHCCSKQKVKRGLWSPEEDEKLVKHITNHGHGCWSSVPKLAGLQRCGKSCRLRWINYLRPDLKRGSFTEHEERIIIDVHRILGNKWAQIAKHLPGRTDNEVKNFWNSCIKKKLIAQGLDPNTHNLLSSHKAQNKSQTKHSLTNASSSLFSISTNVDAHCVDIKTPFVTMLPNSNENSTITTTTSGATITTFEFENPNFVSEFETKNSHCLMEFPSQQREGIPSSSMNVLPGFGVLDENAMWGTDIQPMELVKHEEILLQHQHGQHLQENGLEGVVIEKMIEQNMNNSMMESSNFDFEFMESALMPCGTYCNVNPMDQLAWDC